MDASKAGMLHESGGVQIVSSYLDWQFCTWMTALLHITFQATLVVADIGLTGVVRPILL